jgi:hypothetical protein
MARCRCQVGESGIHKTGRCGGAAKQGQQSKADDEGVERCKHCQFCWSWKNSSGRRRVTFMFLLNGTALDANQGYDLEADVPASHREVPRTLFLQFFSKMFDETDCLLLSERQTGKSASSLGQWTVNIVFSLSFRLSCSETLFCGLGYVTHNWTPPWHHRFVA